MLNQDAVLRAQGLFKDLGYDIDREKLHGVFAKLAGASGESRISDSAEFEVVLAKENTRGTGDGVEFKNFTAAVAHDMRAPLGTAMGYLWLIRELSSDRVDAADYLDAMERCSKKALHVLDEIIELENPREYETHRQSQR